ncbi:MAG: MATE family efflux transporter [Bacteroidales bacterium]|nr:MATE family efflux transporter [Bacteroidales bacterium]
MFFQEYLPYYKRNLKIAIPIIFAQAGQVSVQLIDSIMVGHVGTTELAASSFANSVFIIGLVFGMGFTFGITPLVGQANGKKNLNKASEILINSTVGYSILSVFLSSVMLSVSFLMPFFNQPIDVLNKAIPYYYWLSLSIIPIIIFLIIKQYLEGLGYTKLATIITLIGNLMNIGLNYILIFGHYGFDALGVEGAGIATFLSRIFMALALWLFFILHSKYSNYYRLLKNNRFSMREMLKIIKFSLPISGQIVVEVIAFAFGGIMMGWFDKIPLAAHQIALGMATFTYMLATGVGSATTVRIANQMGEKAYLKMKKAGLASIHLTSMFMGFTAIVFAIFRFALPKLFTNDPEVVSLAGTLLLWTAVFQLADGVQLVSLSALRGLGDVKFTFKISLLAYVVISLTISYLSAFCLDLGPEGIWLGYVFGLIVAGFIFFRRFIKISNNLIGV